MKRHDSQITRITRTSKERPQLIELKLIKIKFYLGEIKKWLNAQ